MLNDRVFVAGLQEYDVRDEPRVIFGTCLLNAFANVKDRLRLLLAEALPERLNDGLSEEDFAVRVVVRNEYFAVYVFELGTLISQVVLQGQRGQLVKLLLRQSSTLDKQQKREGILLALQADRQIEAVKDLGGLDDERFLKLLLKLLSLAVPVNFIVGNRIQVEVKSVAEALLLGLNHVCGVRAVRIVLVFEEAAELA